MKRERGTSFVDFSVVAPVLFTIMFGLIDFGLGYFSVQRISYSAWQVARTASLRAPMDANTAVQLRQQLRNSLPPHEQSSYNIDVLTPYDEPSDHIPDLMIRVRVTGEYPYRFLGAIGVPTRDVDVNIAMRYEHQPILAPAP